MTIGCGSYLPASDVYESPQNGVFCPFWTAIRWHVDCIIRLLVNEDCGPPDC